MINGRAAGSKVRHHLHRHFGRIGGDTLPAHAVIAGKHEYLDVIEPRRIAPLPVREPSGEVFEPTEAARRFGELRLAVRAAADAAGWPNGRSRHAARSSANEANVVTRNSHPSQRYRYYG